MSTNTSPVSAAASSSARPDDRAKAAMTLAGLAYSFPEKLAEYLKDEKLATRGEWMPTWRSGRETGGYFVFVAAHGSADRFAVAIRGTNPSLTLGFFEDVSDDLHVGSTARWEHPVVRDACISQGAADGLRKVLALNDHGTSLLQHLDAKLPNGAELWVTGHSLGGCLAAPLALRLAERYAARGVRVELMTFAAPSAGNAAFARLVESTLPSAQRYYNPHDLVPMAWHDLAQLPRMYAAPGPRCPAVLVEPIDIVAKKATQLGYTQPGAGTPLKATRPMHRAAAGLLSRIMPFLRRKIFAFEAIYQHDPNTYLDLLDAPGLPFRLPLEWVERDLRIRLIGEA